MWGVGHVIFSLHLGVGHSILLQLEGVGHVLSNHHISKCSPPPPHSLYFLTSPLCSAGNREFKQIWGEYVLVVCLPNLSKGKYKDVGNMS